MKNIPEIIPALAKIEQAFDNIASRFPGSYWHQKSHVINAISLRLSEFEKQSKSGLEIIAQYSHSIAEICDVLSDPEFVPSESGREFWMKAKACLKNLESLTLKRLEYFTRHQVTLALSN